jgi:hypothetical protein
MFGWPCISIYICIIYQHNASFVFILLNNQVARSGAVVEALRYKPEGRGFDSW